MEHICICEEDVQKLLDNEKELNALIERTSHCPYCKRIWMKVLAEAPISK